MALTKCPECGRDNVSDSAEMCPGCGFGIRAYFEKNRQEEERAKEQAEAIADAEKKAKELNSEFSNLGSVKPVGKGPQPVNRKALIITIAAAVLLVIGVFAAVNIHSKIMRDKEIKAYCELPAYEASKYENESECLRALLEAKASQSQKKKLSSANSIGTERNSMNTRPYFWTIFMKEPMK